MGFGSSQLGVRAASDRCERTDRESEASGVMGVRLWESWTREGSKTPSWEEGKSVFGGARAVTEGVKLLRLRTNLHTLNLSPQNSFGESHT